MESSFNRPLLGDVVEQTSESTLDRAEWWRGNRPRLLVCHATARATNAPRRENRSEHKHCRPQSGRKKPHSAIRAAGARKYACVLALQKKT
jgi:hypothetical protein